MQEKNERKNISFPKKAVKLRGPLIFLFQSIIEMEFTHSPEGCSTLQTVVHLTLRIFVCYMVFTEATETACRSHAEALVPRSTVLLVVMHVGMSKYYSTMM